MKDTIYRQAAIDEIKALYEWHEIVTEDRAIDHFKRLPSAEPERKKGRWIPFDIPWYKCSECGAVRENKSFMENFCPNCGARMEQEDLK